MELNLFLRFFILSTEFVLYIVCLYNTPWYVRNIEMVSNKNGKKVNISLISFIQIPNKMFLKKPIAWLTAPSVKECRMECTSLATCISFNARRITNQTSQTSRLHCDFFDDDHYKYGRFLIDADDADYYVPKDDCNTKDCDNPIQICEPRYKNGLNNSICKCRNIEYDTCHNQIFNIDTKMFLMGYYEIIPPDWKYSLNLKMIKVKKPGIICKLASFTHGTNFLLYVSVLDGELIIKVKPNSVDTDEHRQSINLQQAYSIEILNRFQGRISGVNEWLLAVSIDGVQVFQKVVQDVMLIQNVQYYLGYNDTCTATIENPEFTILKEEYNVANRYMYQEFTEMENQWMLTYKIAPKETGGDKKFMTLRNDQRLQSVKMSLLNDLKLCFELSMNGGKISIKSNTISINEFVRVTCYEIFDSFLQKDIIRIRVNGTVVGTGVHSSSLPIQYTGGKLWAVNSNTDSQEILFEDTYLGELP